MKIFVVDTKARRVIFEVDYNERIENLKRKLKEKMGININNDIDLLYGGEMLENDNIISDYIDENEKFPVINYLGHYNGGNIIIKKYIKRNTYNYYSK